MLNPVTPINGPLPIRPAFVVFCGFPGSGKDHLARKLVNLFPDVSSYYDCDDILTDEEKRKISTNVFTSRERALKWERMIWVLRDRRRLKPVVITGDSLPDRFTRQYMFSELKDELLLVHVRVTMDTLKTHFEQRRQADDHYFDEKGVAHYIKNWEPIEHPHLVVQNDSLEDEVTKHILLKLAGYVPGLSASLDQL
jgi:shikimate kinase